MQNSEKDPEEPVDTSTNKNETRKSKRLSFQPSLYNRQIIKPQDPDPAPTLNTEPSTPHHKTQAETTIESKETTSSPAEVQEEDDDKNETKLKWKVGDLIDAKDSAHNWYKSKVIQVDSAKNRVKIHFFGWNSRYDQWFDFESENIKVYKEKSEIIEPKTKQEPKEKEKENKKAVAQINHTQAVVTAAKPEHEHVRIENGKSVMAKWIDEMFYPAKTNRYLLKGEIPYYEVKFYDGVKKLVRFNNIREATEEELNLFASPVQDEVPAQPKEQVKQETVEEENKRRAEAELLLAIQQPLLNHDLKPELAEKIEEAKTQIEKETLEEDQGKTETEASGLRKSLRTKRLKTFTDEIVFDLPGSSISYNQSTFNKRRKLSVSQLSGNADVVVETVKNENEKQEESEKKEETVAIEAEVKQDDENKMQVEIKKKKKIEKKCKTILNH